MQDATGTVARLLAAGGPIANRLGAGYEPRPEQLRMADAVAEAMAARSHLLVEAGTGVGKSFAYLVPAIQRALQHGETVVVATNTIALQEQLVAKDVPLLKEILEPVLKPVAAERPADAFGPSAHDEDPGEPLEPWEQLPSASDVPHPPFPASPRSLRAVLVKGRGNYVSVRRLKLTSERQELLLPDAAARRSLHVIEDWAYQTNDGTLSTLPPLERMGVWDKVQSDSGNCMGKKCPTYSVCFYQRARREMEKANLLICNHALFFSDLALRAKGVGFLPQYDHVVLDEAHGIEDVAADHFGVSLTEAQVIHLLGTLYQRKGGKGYLAQLQLVAGNLDAVSRAVERVQIAEAACRALFDQLLRLHRTGELRNGRIRRRNIVRNDLTPAMNDLVLRLKALKELLPAGASGDVDRFELTAYMQRAGAIADAAETILAQTAGENEDDYVYWVEVSGGAEDEARGGGGGGRMRVKIACSPIEVAPILKAQLFEKEHSTILTSATLATRTAKPGEPTEQAETAFAHFMSRTGSWGAKTLQLGSPFDYRKQVEVYVDKTMPEPRSGGGAGDMLYLRHLCQRIHDHVVATDGGAFVLFTSFALLNQAAGELRGPFEALGYELLAQGADGSRTAILQRFRERGDAVLFGAASFWQGVDVRGRALRNVIITRLPFDPPDRPLTEARCERIQARGGSPFAEDTIPRAVIRFKQGFGRLVRSHEDKGRVVILDPRVKTKPYGRLFLRALPEGVEPIVIS